MDRAEPAQRAGLASLALVLWESWLAARRPQAAPGGTRLLWIFRAPIGAAVAGTGALLAAIAFPLDDYWHTLYGIDVTLWAPFHVMIVGSVLLIGVGTLFMLAAELRSAGAVSIDGPADGRYLVRAADADTLADALAAVPRPTARVRVEVDPPRV